MMLRDELEQALEGYRPTNEIQPYDLSNHVLRLERTVKHLLRMIRILDKDQECKDILDTLELEQHTGTPGDQEQYV